MYYKSLSLTAILFVFENHEGPYSIEARNRGWRQTHSIGARNRGWRQTHVTHNCIVSNKEYPNKEAIDVIESSGQPGPGTNPHNIGKKSGPNAAAIAGRREATLLIGVQGTRR